MAIASTTTIYQTSRSYGKQEQVDQEILFTLLRRFKPQLVENNFDEIYQSLNSTFQASDKRYIGRFTDLLMAADVNPLLYMKAIPDYYLYGSRDVRELIIPRNIVKMGNCLFANSNCQKVDVHRDIILNRDSYINAPCNLKIYYESNYMEGVL